jgi:hypothetical protein
MSQSRDPERISELFAAGSAMAGEGDPASIKLMGYSQIVRRHVGSIARGINVSNTQPDPSKSSARSTRFFSPD